MSVYRLVFLSFGLSETKKKDVNIYLFSHALFCLFLFVLSSSLDNPKLSEKIYVNCRGRRGKAREIR